MCVSRIPPVFFLSVTTIVGFFFLFLASPAIICRFHRWIYNVLGSRI